MDIPLSTMLQYISWWIAFWTIVNFLLPPREIFDGVPGFQKGYNILLALVAYYGSLNIRQFTVQLYGKMGVPLTPSPQPIEKAKTEGFAQGVGAAKAAVEEVKPPTTG